MPERDVLLISGTEPSLRWRTFCNAVLDIAERCGVESVVTFGSLIADVAHTRPVPITGLATSRELVERLGFEDVSYEGPTGVVGVLHAIARGARHGRREPLGGDSPLRRGGPQSEGRPGPVAAARGADRDPARGPAISSRPRASSSVR